MNRDVFTAGIEHGGLTTDYEVRMLVCWLLHQIKTPLTMTQLNHALQQDGLVNYFELTRAVGTLKASGHLKDTGEPGGGALPFTVTEVGVETAEAFERSIPLTVREKALAAAKECLLLERMERENRVSITETKNGWQLELGIGDLPAELLSLSMYVPTEELCEAMKRRFLRDPTELYRAVLAAMTGEQLDAPKEK